MTDAAPLLRTEALTKSFSGFVAVQGVNLDVKAGTIHALIGPNGAGKTTFFNLLTRFLPATSGRIFYKGRDITDTRPHEIARLGIVRSFQISAVFPHLTVLENVRIALQRFRGDNFSAWKARPTRSRPICPMAASARSNSRRRWRSSRNCCCSTNRPQAWRTRISAAPSI